MYRFLPAILALSLLLSCSGKDNDLSSAALFTPLSYEAQGEAFNPENQYRNPIIPGFYPDPSICRVGDDYYLVNSSFQYFPGIPVWHSTDLVHWESCGSALYTDNKIRFWNELMQFGIFAPHISYNPGNGKFYIICTQVNGDLGNFFVTSDDPKSGVWSDPVKLPDVPGIDPSILFDTDGKAYITSAAGLDSVGETPLYWGGNAIVLWDFDWEKGVTTGERRIIARYGVHPEESPQALEGPHLYHVGDTYFMMCAEGGTETGHSEVLFSGDNPYGPFTPCAINPILTQRDLPADRDNPVSCTGHADLVQTAAGNWYAVFLGCQSYEGIETFNTGRQTFLLPVEWIDGQPVILKAGEPVPTVVDLSDELKDLVAKNTIKGFDGYNPGPLWSKDGLSPIALSIRGSMDGKISFLKDGRMSLECGNVPLDVLGRPSAVLERITSKTFKAETVMEFNPAPGSEAGLMCWHDDDHYMKLTKTIGAEGKPVLRLEERSAPERKELFTLLFGRLDGRIIYTYDLPLEGKEADCPLALKVEAVDPVTYVFSYAPAIGKELNFKQVGEPRNGRHLSTLNCGGFQGAMVGVYACKNGKYEVESFKTKSGAPVDITLIKHGSLEIRYKGISIQVDPVSGHGKTTDYATEFPKADVILITHEHGDHLDDEAIKALEKDGTRLLLNGASAEKIGRGEVIANGESTDLPGGIHLDAVPAYNSTPDRKNFHPKGNGNGYVLTIDGLRIYVAGDTEDIPEMADLKDIDVAFLPVNQPYTMTVEQCVAAAKSFNPKVLIPYHFSKTNLSGLPAELPGIDVRLRQMQ